MKIYGNSETKWIEFFAKFYHDESTMAGVFTMLYRIDVLYKIVSPLYQVSDDVELETKNFNLFIYVNEVDTNTGEITYPEYD